MEKNDTQEIVRPDSVAAEGKQGVTFGQRLAGGFKKIICSVWFWLLLGWPLGFLLIAAVKNQPDLADWYNRYLYRYIAQGFNNVTGCLPFSLGEILLLILPVGALIYFIGCVIAVMRKKGRRWRTLLLALVQPVSVGAVVFFLFVTNCGLNYYCSDVSTQLGWEPYTPTTEQLYELCVYLADHASQSREKLPENPDGTVQIDWSAAAQQARQAVNDLHQTYDFVPDGYSLPKSVLLSHEMSYLDITGVYFPWTFEANVNTDVPGYTKVFTACHELMHVRGFMHEEDANFLAYLACIGSSDETLRYAGYASAMKYMLRYIRRADNKLYSQVVMHISDAVLRDMAAESQYWSQFETPIAEAAVKVNDTYLKQNNQPSGVLSYSQAAELIITHYFRSVAHAQSDAAQR